MSDRTLRVTVCGSFRRGREQLMTDIVELKMRGVEILSPRNVHGEDDFGREVDGFVYLKGEEDESPADLESRHLEALCDSDFVWLHTLHTVGIAASGDGTVLERMMARYLGPSAAFEVGVAHALGLPIYTRYGFPEPALRDFVREVNSPADAVTRVLSASTPVAPAGGVSILQAYYKKICIARGWAHEDAKDCMLLLTEELGEVAKAVRTRVGISHSSPERLDLGKEMADVQLLLLHLANIMNIDLGAEVACKEMVNAERHALSKMGRP